MSTILQGFKAKYLKSSTILPGFKAGYLRSSTILPGYKAGYLSFLLFYQDLKPDI